MTLWTDVQKKQCYDNSPRFFCGAFIVNGLRIYRIHNTVGIIPLMYQQIKLLISGSRSGDFPESAELSAPLLPNKRLTPDVTLHEYGQENHVSSAHKIVPQACIHKHFGVQSRTRSAHAAGATCRSIIAPPPF